MLGLFPYHTNYLLPKSNKANFKVGQEVTCNGCKGVIVLIFPTALNTEIWVKMTCNWKLGDVRKTIDFVIEKDLKKVEEELFNVCLSTAKSAKDGHTYKNYKGQLESSIGVIILKNRQEVTQWSMVASSGSDPARGLQDIKNLIYNKIVGKHSLT